MTGEKTTTDSLVARWSHVTGSERANYQLFVADLCRLLDVPEPEPASDDTRDNAYVFERRVTFAHGDGGTSAGFIDCYRRGAFVLEAKKVKASAHTKGFDDALMRARSQAEGYARALPAAEGRPPFLVVIDVGHVIEVYAEFTRSGATYTPFPDARSHRIRLDDLRDEAVQDRLRRLWLDPMSLDPARASAKVTRQVSNQLAKLARSLEAADHRPQAVAAFLTRCLFCMFAEDVGLLPKDKDGRGAFAGLLRRYQEEPDTLRQMLAALWSDMDHGGFSAALTTRVLRFNGKLFKGAAKADYVLPLGRQEIDDLLAAASANWREVEPSIFGTLLERALDPNERAALGAHYTPRAYVERLVLPTVVEPLRAEWASAQAAALLLSIEANALEGKKREEKLAEARSTIKAFHHRLCTVRVLDPACGSGNFLYVTLEHLKRMEGEVMDRLHALGEHQVRLGFEGETVTPKQLLGIELNERAAALAELVLWIGYLQWHIRTFGNASVAEPVVHDYGNIEWRDAVLAWDDFEPMVDADGNVVTRWDGLTKKVHPATGELVPDESAVVPQRRYLNPRAASWPEADFIVGNPPYLGARTIRPALDDGYLVALRSAHPALPDNIDFVMYWWHHAGRLTTEGRVRGFGLITTKSFRQSFNRAVVGPLMGAGLRIGFAIPDHPWVDASDGAAVRVAMTVGVRDDSPGALVEVVEEGDSVDGEVQVTLRRRMGTITPDLRISVDVGNVPPLTSNRRLSCVGYQLTGLGFVVDSQKARALDPAFGTGAAVAKPLLSGSDLTRSPRGLYALDLYAWRPDGLREERPAVLQHVLDHVKPERDVNAREALRRNWWIFGEARSTFRPALLGTSTAIATSLTARHRTFVAVNANTVCDSTTVMFALPDLLFLGVLSSSVHVEWAIAAGGRMGVGNDPRYNKSRCFEPFPFPSDDTGLTPQLSARIRQLGEQLDAHRKARQSAHSALTLTGIYNVLEKVRAGQALVPRERETHEQALVSVLRTLHDDLDSAVLEAYGWTDLSPALADRTATDVREAAVGTLLERLVALNAKRAAEEAAGTVRWLRPEFQHPAAVTVTQATIDTGADEEAAVEEAPAKAAIAQQAWPTTLPEQIKAVADVLTGAGGPLTIDEIAARFKARGRWRERLPTIVEALQAIGRARAAAGEDERYVAGIS